MAGPAYALGSGVTNTARVNAFEIGDAYSKYDIAYFSGYTIPGTPPVPTSAESLGVASGHYYYSGDSAQTSAVSNAPGTDGTNWTQDLFFEPSYGSSVSYENNAYNVAYGDGYYNLLAKSENALSVKFNMSYNKRSDKESKALIHLFEDSFNKGEKDTGAYTGIYYTPFEPYSKSGEFYIEAFSRTFDYPDVNSINTVLSQENASTLDWQGYYIPFHQTQGYFAEGNSYSTHDIAYLSGTIPGGQANDRFKIHQSGWYYYTGATETVADTANSPTGDTSLWTKDRFYFPLNQGVSVPESPRYIKQTSQNDYFIRTQDGINKSILNIQFELEGRNDKEAKAVVHFLETHKGHHLFEFTPPAPYDITGKAFICPQWEHKINYKNNNTVSVNLIEAPLNTIGKNVAFSSLVTVDPYFVADFS